MQLTLRVLLDYLDDRLEPTLARDVGSQLEDHDRARQLIDRIRRVVRRRRLSTPDVAERSELPLNHEDDPNQVAAYLDGRLDSEQDADFEQICLDTDVYLAEVSACHQIASIGDYVIRVPPMARQRMYGLVKGPEAQQLRVVPRETRHSKPPLWEVDGKPSDHDEEDQSLLEPLYHDLAESRWRRLIPIAALVLAATLLGLVIWNLPQGQEVAHPTELALAAKPQPLENTENVTKAPEKRAEPDIVKVDMPIQRFHAVWPVILSEEKPSWQSITQTVGAVSAMVAARPVNMYFALGKEFRAPEPVTPLPRVENALPAIAPPQRDVHLQLGLNGADALGMFLKQNAAQEWSLIRPQAGIISNELLMALPGYTGSIALQTQLRLTLVGQYPGGQGVNSYAEAVVELHPTPDADLDVTLHRGRMVLAGRPEGATAKVRMRYQGETWEISLPANAEIGFQSTGKVLSGQGDWQLIHRLDMVMIQGTVDVKYRGQGVTLDAKAQLSWSSRANDGRPGTTVALMELPAWTKRTTAAKEAVNGLVALRSRTHHKLTTENKDQTWLRLACEESLEERSPIERQAGILCLAAMDHLKPLIRSLNDAQNGERRKISREALISWVGQEQDRVGKLLSSLIDAGYPEEDAKLLLALYRGPGKAAPETVQALLQHMNHGLLAIRDQAFVDLCALLPERPTGYDATAGEEQRLKAIEVLRARLVQPMKKSTAPVPLPP